jgi:hypothetical protein
MKKLPNIWSQLATWLPLISTLLLTRMQMSLNKEFGTWLELGP